MCVCVPRVFCASKNPSFLARWRVRGPAGTGSVGDSVGKGSGAGVERLAGRHLAGASGRAGNVSEYIFNEPGPTTVCPRLQSIVEVSRSFRRPPKPRV